MESEESGYRSLLREVIESRGSGPGIDLTHLRREKKKKREAERGGSKGRKLRSVLLLDLRRHPHIHPGTLCMRKPRTSLSRSP